MRFYIADLHFFHAAMNDKMDNRGFSSVEEMNEHIIAKWNKRVKKKDEVVILGDLSWGNVEMTNELIKRLNGKLYLIQGNHDLFVHKRDANLERFVWVKHYAEMSDNGRKVVLCHYPIICYNGQYHFDSKGNPRTYMLYGHVHDTMDQKLIEQFQEITRNTKTVNVQGEEMYIPCNMINCFCKYSDYVPLTLDEWIEVDKKRRGER